MNHKKLIKTALNPTTKTKGIELKESISLMLLDFLKKNGKTYKSRNQYYYFSNKKKKLIPILCANRRGASQDFKNFITAQTGFNTALTPIFEYFFQAFQTKISETKEIELKNFSYYDRKTACLYIHNQRNKILKITKDNFEIVDNGMDDILFLSNPRFEEVDFHELFGKIATSKNKLQRKCP